MDLPKIVTVTFKVDLSSLTSSTLPVKLWNGPDLIRTVSPAAYENFDMAAKHNPQDAKAFHYLALAAARIPGYTRQTVQAIETAVLREPMNPLYLKDAGMLCKRAGLTAKAERYFEETLKWDASNSDALNGLAELRETKEAAKGGFSIFGKR